MLCFAKFHIPIYLIFLFAQLGTENKYLKMKFVVMLLFGSMVAFHSHHHDFGVVNAQGGLDAGCGDAGCTPGK